MINKKHLFHLLFVVYFKYFLWETLHIYIFSNFRVMWPSNLKAKPDS